MARLLVYDAYENKVYTYSSLRENDPMPYSTGRTLTVREFRGKSNSPVLWTTIAAMEAWNLTRRKYGRGIPVGYAFRRIWEGGHGTRSQHYAGVAFDVGQSLSQTQRTAIYNAARSTGAWGYVEPLSQTPTWVHFARRYGKTVPPLSETQAGELLAYAWPGNIRELRSLVERAVILHRGGGLPLLFGLHGGQAATAGDKEGGQAQPSLPEGPVAPENLPTLEEAEALYLRRVMRLAKGRVRGEGGAAALLRM